MIEGSSTKDVQCRSTSLVNDWCLVVSEIPNGIYAKLKLYYFYIILFIL